MEILGNILGNIHGKSARRRVVLQFPLLVLLNHLSGCGSDSPQNSVPVAEPPAITQLSISVDEDEPYDSSGESPLATQTLSGRVADGYIRGAIVCFDIDGSGSCDAKEPSTISSRGGIYSIAVPRNVPASSLIAEIPETAIDEDTGRAVGASMTFSTVSARARFISPLTTLVSRQHQENPAGSIETAEKMVLALLGMPNAATGTLSVNYVENRNHSEQAVQHRFRFLHESARMIAATFGEMNTRAQAAVVDSGIDLVADVDAQQVLRMLVLDETLNIVPQIAAAVSEVMGIAVQANGTIKSLDGGWFDVTSGTELSQLNGAAAITSTVAEVSLEGLIPDSLFDDIAMTLELRKSRLYRAGNDLPGAY